uniref:ORF44b n=1 Tax=Pinus thunbergii TaxID=3350 RepID=Q37045_PINTH|nr:ORF44b [Pinus thunbergii]BAA04461.1 ORF44b [Pinus thunbergii]
MSIDSDLKLGSSGLGPIYILSLILDSCQIFSIDIQITFHFIELI